MVMPGVVRLFEIFAIAVLISQEVEACCQDVCETALGRSSCETMAVPCVDHACEWTALRYQDKEICRCVSLRNSAVVHSSMLYSLILLISFMALVALLYWRFRTRLGPRPQQETAEQRQRRHRGALRLSQLRSPKTIPYVLEVRGTMIPKAELLLPIGATENYEAPEPMHEDSPVRTLPLAVVASSASAMDEAPVGLPGQVNRSAGSSPM
mmetsp:Transcript_10588/g.16586  ORF Transcript_10588/g.16586 Transcript_10588/m.16586 type:complete len:210 (+) Transcript_10588:120-749(+)|eukprot:CAMPEP_0184314994 /NCGR_PEP_ID=MMETSP1049-20130417/79148_1 /TAXON_ID=77928 /ORGANISM="Proteomonas sulcata, Strain CCMP704" /LENGTH=209 /DNA_ID=CAMNT_0026633227 /DNA_START=64 /DNA_END=693 /DNA_ORIENTATION=-